MNNVLRVDVLKGLNDLEDVACSDDFRVVPLCLEVFVEFSLRTILQNQVDLVLIEEEPVQLHDMRVLQVTLDLDFPSELVLYFALEQLTLVENLQRDNKLAFLLASQVHVAKLASA